MIELTSEITVRPIQQCGGDEMVIAAAKVSTSGEEAAKFVEANPEDNYGLIKFLMRHRHGSPFEHSFMTFFVHAPIFVFREWHRHRWMSFNEESARYKKLKPVFWIPRLDRKMRPVEGYKPSQPEFRSVSPGMYSDILNSMEIAYEYSWEQYIYLLDRGVAREVARAVLPVGIYSSCWVSANPRSLMHFLSLRTHDSEAKFVSYPQAEIEEAARACEQTLAAGWPLTYKAWQECGRVAP